MQRVNLKPKPISTDCHFHIFEANSGVARARYVPTYAATLAGWALAARACGVVRGVVVQPSFLGTDNTQLLAALATNPRDLRGVAVVAPDVSADSLRELRSAGVRGVRLNLSRVPTPSAHMTALSAAWWRALVSNDLHVELLADAHRVAELIPMVPADITLVLDHFALTSADAAGEATFAALAKRAQHAPAQTFVKLSAAYRLPDPAAAPALTQRLRDTLGADALLWGSDWPCTNHEAYADIAALRWRFDAWVNDAPTRLKILTDNPARLYWRD